MEKSSVDPLPAPFRDILQPENGYRFSTDSILLAAHVQAENMANLIDIGTGCGIISLLLARRYPDLDITAIELEKEAYGLACQNVLNSGFKNRIHLINKDINKIRSSDLNGPADLIVSNPPYKKKGSGRLNPDTRKALARHEIHLDINQLFNCSERLLKSNGHLYLIFPADRMADLQLAMDRYHFCAGFLRFVHIKEGMPPKRVVLCAIKNHCLPCAIKPALYIYSGKKKYTEEYLNLIQMFDTYL